MIERGVVDDGSPDESTPATPDQIRAARQVWQQDDLVIDDNAVVSECGALGVWVSAWVWMPASAVAEEDSSVGQEGL